MMGQVTGDQPLHLGEQSGIPVAYVAEGQLEDRVGGLHGDRERTGQLLGVGYRERLDEQGPQPVRDHRVVLLAGVEQAYVGDVAEAQHAKARDGAVHVDEGVDDRADRVVPVREVTLGEAVTLETARRRADFPVLVPEAVGRPDGVYVDDAPRRVDLVYRPRDGLPRLLISEFRALATPMIEKTIGEATRIERLTVGDDPAFFITGADHGFAYLLPSGQANFETQRLAGPTLLVERSDGVLLRVEGELTREQAVRIAESVR